MKKLLLTLMLALVSTGAVAEWIGVSENDDFTGYADIATISKAGNKVKMWGLVDYRAAQVSPDGQFLSSKSQAEYDCKEKQRRVLAFSWFSGNMEDGEVIHSNSDPGRWMPVAGVSLWETLWKKACGKE